MVPYLNLGLIFVTGGGIYYFDVFNTYAAGFTLFVIGALECFATGWYYPTFFAEVEEHTGARWLTSGKKMGLYWVIMWKYVCPCILGILSIVSFISLFSIDQEIGCKVKNTLQ